MLKDLLVVAAATFALLGHAQAQTMKTVKVGTTNLSSDIGLFLAEKRGYFRDEGLKVELVPFDAGAKMVAPLGAGDLDAGAGAASAGLYNAVNRGLKLKMVADKGTNISGYSYKALMVRKDLIESGAFKSLADLKGKKVAIIANGAADESVINQALKKAGLKDDDIEKVFLPFPQHLTAFANKAIDASISAEPGVTAMIRNNAAVRFVGIDDFYPVQQTAMLLINGKFADDRKTVTAFLKAYLRGVRDYVATLKDGKIAGPGAETMIRDIAEMTGIRDTTLLHQMVPVFIDPDGQINRASVETDLAYLKSRGLVANDISAEGVVDMSFVEELKPVLGSFKASN
ncbi:ABC transporter substrate-binding protein [Rhodopseudomonas boonkerdii]|uniref:ABC transporter substrate-binding protein n=1 Tax=Rhodopseudomonas boonkerdii TaxID=475937 RepID=UPI001E527747|nr:ABC transporter substrate-binding protein [Rhodopseudomonas boonkerdii]